MRTRQQPKPKLKPGVIYYGDNGRRLCINPACGGMTAIYTGYDCSGQKVVAAKYEETIAWHADASARRL